MLARRMTFNMKRHLARIEAELSDYPVDRIFSRAESSLADVDKPIQVVVDCLTGIGSFAAQQACVSIVKGDEQSWQDLHTSWQYVSWDTFVYIQRYDYLAETYPDLLRRGRLPIGQMGWTGLNQAVLTMAEAIAMREDRYAKWCGERLLKNLRSEKDDTLLIKHGWTGSPVEPFLAKLYALWTKQSLELVDLPIAKMGVYGWLLDSWTNEAEFEESLHRICDYHCKHMYGDDDAFDSAPFNVFPVEIVAMKRVREELGLGFPKIEHPLLDTPLFNVPNLIPKKEPDELLQRFIDRCRAEMPSLEVLW